MPTRRDQGCPEAAIFAVVLTLAIWSGSVVCAKSLAGHVASVSQDEQHLGLARKTALKTAQGCDEELWRHVYHPRRLHVIAPCVSVIGTIALIRRERDGDYHILIRLDPAYLPLLNEANVVRQRGDLVVEPICEHRVTQNDAIQACRGFDDRMPVPRVGSHVQITGAYVLDADHGWMEIHPVSSIARAGQ